jgi:hypothetical protein
VFEKATSLSKISLNANRIDLTVNYQTANSYLTGVFYSNSEVRIRFYRNRPQKTAMSRAKRGSAKYMQARQEKPTMRIEKRFFKKSMPKILMKKMRFRMKLMAKKLSKY